MSDLDKRSRLNNFEKRRKTTKAISILFVVASVLFIVLISIWIFGGKEDTVSKDPDEDIAETEIKEPEKEIEIKDKDLKDKETDAESIIDEEEEEDREDEGVKIEGVEASDDNVLEAYTGNWQPVGTEQAEPHQVNYGESQDRVEMEEAISVATDLEEMFVWWIENGGDQKVIATVSTIDKIDTYRVYLSWIANEGWQPIKVENLKVNDKK